MKNERCEICHHNPSRVQNAWRECSHVDCPFRPVAGVGDDIPVELDRIYFDEDEGGFVDEN